jgi:RNA polymerase sigma-70 factor (ECF subfamily)
MSSEATAFFPGPVANARESSASSRSEIEAVNREKSVKQVSIDQAITQPPNEAEIADEDLLEEVSRGAREPLAILFRRHAQSVRNVAKRILRDEAEADDLLQEVFLYIFRKANLFDASQGSARSWIYHVAYHRAFNRRRYLTLRQFYNREELNENLVGLNHNNEPGLPIDALVANDLMDKFDHHLSKEQRQAIHLYFVEGYSLREIAERTGQTIGNVRHHYYRGLEKLRSYLLQEKVRSK